MEGIGSVNETASMAVLTKASGVQSGQKEQLTALTDSVKTPQVANEAIGQKIDVTA